MTVAVLPVFVATLAGASVGALAARRNKTRGALIGGGIGLTAGLIANAVAGQFGASLGNAVGGAQAAASLVPLVAARRGPGPMGVAGGCGCKGKKVTEVGSTLGQGTTQTSTQNPTSSEDPSKPCCDDCAKKAAA
jgi:hypothetical protein